MLYKGYCLDNWQNGWLIRYRIASVSNLVQWRTVLYSRDILSIISLFCNFDIISKLKVKPRNPGFLPWPTRHLPLSPASLPNLTLTTCPSTHGSVDTGWLSVFPTYQVLFHFWGFLHVLIVASIQNSILTQLSSQDYSSWHFLKMAFDPKPDIDLVYFFIAPWTFSSWILSQM